MLFTTGQPLVNFIRSSRTRSKSLVFSYITVDRDRTVSQRSKPISCITLIGEQPNPWNLLQLRDVIRRHRGAKQLHR